MDFMPHAGGGLHQRLVPVEVVLGDEVITQSHRVTEVGDERVLVEEVCCVGAVRAEVSGSDAVAEVVVLVGVLLCALRASAALR